MRSSSWRDHHSSSGCSLEQKNSMQIGAHHSQRSCCTLDWSFWWRNRRLIRPFGLEKLRCGWHLICWSHRTSLRCVCQLRTCSCHACLMAWCNLWSQRRWFCSICSRCVSRCPVPSKTDLIRRPYMESEFQHLSVCLRFSSWWWWLVGIFSQLVRAF